MNALTIQEELSRIAGDGRRPSVLAYHSPVGMRYVADGGIDLISRNEIQVVSLVPATSIQ